MYIYLVTIREKIHISTYILYVYFRSDTGTTPYHFRHYKNLYPATIGFHDGEGLISFYRKSSGIIS
jgi:hypothetical protein